MKPVEHIDPLAQPASFELSEAELAQIVAGGLGDFFEDVGGGFKKAGEAVADFAEDVYEVGKDVVHWIESLDSKLEDILIPPFPPPFLPSPRDPDDYDDLRLGEQDFALSSISGPQVSESSGPIFYDGTDDADYSDSSREVVQIR